MKKTPKHPIYRVSSKDGRQAHVNDLKAYCTKFGLNYKTVHSQITSSLGYNDDVRTIRRIYLVDVSDCDF